MRKPALCLFPCSLVPQIVVALCDIHAISLHRIHERHEILWFKKIIGIEDGKIFPLCHLDPDVPRARSTEVLRIPPRKDAVVFLCIGSQHIARAICRTVIDCDEAEIAKRLRLKRVETRREILSRIVNWHDDGDRLRFSLLFCHLLLLQSLRYRSRV